MAFGFFFFFFLLFRDFWSGQSGLPRNHAFAFSLASSFVRERAFWMPHRHCSRCPTLAVVGRVHLCSGAKYLLNLFERIWTIRCVVEWASSHNQERKFKGTSETLQSVGEMVHGSIVTVKDSVVGFQSFSSVLVVSELSSAWGPSFSFLLFARDSSSSLSLAAAFPTASFLPWFVSCILLLGRTSLVAACDGFSLGYWTALFLYNIAGFQNSWKFLLLRCSLRWCFCGSFSVLVCVSLSVKSQRWGIGRDGLVSQIHMKCRLHGTSNHPSSRWNCVKIRRTSI